MLVDDVVVSTPSAVSREGLREKRDLTNCEACAVSEKNVCSICCASERRVEE